MSNNNQGFVIGITGKIGSGKSTVSKYIEENYGFTEYSMAQPLKKIGELFFFSKTQLYGTQEQKLEEHTHWGISAREFLQKIGTELFREHLPKVMPKMKSIGTVWVDLFCLRYKKERKKYVISDVRFLDEANVVKELNGIIIRCVRDNNVTSNSGQELTHKSEQEINRINHDYVLDNNKCSISEVQERIDRIMRGHGIEKIQKPDPISTCVITGLAVYAFCWVYTRMVQFALC